MTLEEQLEHLIDRLKLVIPDASPEQRLHYEKIIVQAKLTRRAFILYGLVDPKSQQLLSELGKMIFEVNP